MTRTRDRTRDETAAPRPAPQTVRRALPESAEDRLGAQGAWAARRVGPESVWTEIAEVVQRLLERTRQAEAAPVSAPVAAAPPQLAATPAEARAPAAPAPEPGPAGPRGARPAKQTPEAAPLPQGAPGASPERPKPQAELEPQTPPAAQPPEAEAPAQAGPAPAPAEEAPDAGAGPGQIVRLWQTGVRTAAHALPGVTVKIRPAARAGLDRAATGAAARNRQARADLGREALANVRPPPAPEQAPPAPPPQNPVPEETRRILDLSGKRLADQTPPALTPSPVRAVESVEIGGSLPQVGDEPLRPDVFESLVAPGGQALLQPGEQGLESGEARMLREARDKLEAARARTDQPDQPGRGPQVIPPDQGPRPIPPLPASLQAPVGRVVARLLAQTDETVAGVLDELREQAYPGGVLKRTFPDAGKDMAEGLRTAVTSDLREIAAAANVTAGELDREIAARRAELEASAIAAQSDAAREGREAAGKTAGEGQKTLDAIDGAARAADEEALRRQEAAGGDADPAVVNRRRDQVVGWIRNQVTTQITAYQEAGDARERALRKALAEQVNAYGALAQREQYQVFTPTAPRPPRNPDDAAREARLADVSVAIRAWTDERIKWAGEQVGRLVKDAAAATRRNRSAIETAGSAGVEAARRWAEDRVLAGQTWWTRFLFRVRRWIAEANDANEQWRVRRTQLQRDTVAVDLQAVAMAQARIAAGMTQDQIQADTTLSSATRAIVAQYFAAGRDPLQFAAERLRGTIALDHVAHAREVFEAELIARPVAYRDAETAEKLAEIARSTGGPFDPEGIARKLRAAMDQIGTDEDLIFSSLRGITPFRGHVVRKFYRVMYDRDLDKDIDDEMSGDEYRQAMAELEGQQSKADAIAIHDAVAGFGTDEAKIYATLRGKSPEEVEAIRAEYLARYGETLDAALKGDLSEGNEIDQANALLQGDTAQADAIALDEAMRGGVTGLGTDEDEINKVLTRVREESLERARAEHWTSAQLQAEVRRRLAEISERFGRQYGDVAQYQAPGLEGGTVLERALGSELSGAELDLSRALLKNDMTAADAARLEIERTGFYTSDSAVNAVLRGQYERSLELRRLDEGPERSLRVRSLVERLREQRNPRLSDEEISRQRIALERQMEQQMASGAQRDAGLSMTALQDVYRDRYKLPVEFVVAFGMDGKSQAQAFALLRNGGYLDPLQEVELATEGLGTDTDVLKRTLKVMTKSEIDDLRTQWELRHRGESFDAMLRGELSGRDESDIMDMVAHGAPESDIERIDQERRRVRREMQDLTGVLGGAAAGPEAAWMQHSVGRLDALERDLRRTDWADTPEDRRAREALSEKVDTQVQAVQDAVEDHRRRIDSVTDFATQVVGLVVGVTVAVVLGAISGGTLGVVTIALLASLYATAATMATKLLIKGGAYGEEDVLTDVALGAVDALTAAATAGLGSKLLKPLQAVVAKTRVKDVAAFIGRSGLAQRVTGAAESSTLARAATRLAPSPAALEKGVASFLAHSVENAAGAVPSTFLGMAASDETWKGEPLHAFLAGGGMSVLQAVAMGHAVSGALHVSGSLFTHARGMARMGSEVGRLLEANRLVAEGFGKFHEKQPGASIADFLAHQDGKNLRAEIERRGLLPVLETANRAVAEAPGATRPETAAPHEARVAELHGALPEKLREGSFVTPDTRLEGRTVKVEPLRIGKEIVGVDIRVGPDATPLDIALHGGTVNAMLKYRGLLGGVRRSLEDFAAMLTGSGLTVGSRGWEARLELGKLPGILASRMDELAGRRLHPAAEARALADIEGLQRQFQTHQAILANPRLREQSGRGFVAAEDTGGSFDWGPSRTPEGKLTEAGVARLDDAVEAFRSGREGGDPAPMEGHLDAIAELSGLPRETARNFLTLEPGERVGALELMNTLRDSVASWEGPQDDAHIADDVARLAETLRITPHEARSLALHPDEHPGPMRLLTDETFAAPEPPLRKPRGAKPELPAESGEAFLAREIAALKDARRTRRARAPGDLIERIGGRKDSARRKAQKALNERSAAPKDYEVVNLDMDRLSRALTGPDSERRSGVVRVGEAEFRISRGPVTVADPNPPFHFEGEFPPWSEIGRRVVQFDDGALRVWRAPPEEGFPDGRLIQETIVGPRRERAGHEQRAQKPRSELELPGPPTERAHAHGAGRGPESPFGILHAPVEVNQLLQKRGVEVFLERLRDSAPPGAEFHYVTEIRPQPDNIRLAEVTYRIDVSLNGERMPFAEFRIDVDPAEAIGKAPAEVRGRDILQVDTIEFRSHENPQVQRVLEHLAELVDVPRFAQHGLGRGEPVTAVAAAALLSQVDTQGVRDTIAASRGALVALTPEPRPGFSAAAWEKRVSEHFESESWARFVVVDIRGLDLTKVQILDLEAAIDRLGDKGARQIALIR